MNFSFDRSLFHPKRNNIFLNELPKILKNNILDIKSNLNLEIVDICSLNNLLPNSILFIDKKYIEISSNFNLLLITNSIKIFESKTYKNIILVKNLNEAYLLIANKLFIHEDNLDFSDDFLKINDSFISKLAMVHPTSSIAKNCIIGRGVKIGKNCIIKQNSIIKNSILGDNIIIGENSTIGSTGFGFSLENMGANNILPQLGIVYISSNTRIGANCSIDRGKLDYTFIGENSMLDNLIHIAHNVVMGSNVCIAAQTGISGSVKIGNNVIIGGQVGLAGHIVIGNDVMIAAKSGVTKNIKDKSVVAGFPAVDIKEWKRSIINLKKYGYK